MATRFIGAPLLSLSLSSYAPPSLVLLFCQRHSTSTPPFARCGQETEKSCTGSIYVVGCLAAITIPTKLSSHFLSLSFPKLFSSSPCLLTQFPLHASLALLVIYHFFLSLLTA